MNEMLRAHAHSSPQNLEPCTLLRRLSLQSNRLTSLGSGLLQLTNLEELQLSHNGLKDTLGLHTLVCLFTRHCFCSRFACQVNLRVLDLGNNQIAKLEKLEPLTKLEELWVRCRCARAPCFMSRDCAVFS